MGLAALWEDLDEECPLGESLVWSEGAGGRPPVDFGPDRRLLIEAYLALGADLTAASSTWTWTRITDYVRYQPGINVTSGRFDESSRVTPGSGRFQLDNRDGRFSRNNPTGPYYGQLSRNTPVLVTANPGTGAYPLIQQFANEWPARMDSTLTDFVVSIQTGGIMRRLQQGAKPLKSALFRAITADADTVAYWPLEDGTSAVQFSSGFEGDPPMRSIGSSTVTPAGQMPTAVVGSTPLVIIGGGVNTLLSGAVPTYTDTQSWTVAGLYYCASAPDSTASSLFLETYSTGTLRLWRLYWRDSDDAVVLDVYDADGTAVFTATSTSSFSITNAQLVGHWAYFWVSATQDGSAVDYEFGVDFATASYSKTGTQASQTLGIVKTIQVSNGGATSDVTVGHVYVTDSASTGSSPAASALDGYDGETAATRIARLCSEEGVEVTIAPGTVTSAAMGPQSTATFMDLLRECESADNGVLYEHGFGLGYQPLSARYHAPVALNLDFPSGDIGVEPEPADDDQQLRNRWVITRSNGSSAWAEDTDSIGVDGLYEASATVNVQTDAQALQVAAWLVHLGTNEGPRWPSLGLRFDNAAGLQLIPEWVDMGYGARVRVTSPPSQIVADPLDLIVEGVTQFATQFEWTATIATSDARPYGVFILDHPRWGLMDTDGSTLASAIGSSDTSLSVATTTSGSPLWTTNAAHFPFDIHIGGEQITVTAVAGGSSPQTFTVTRAVNGVSKSHSSGAAVSLWRPGVLAL